MINSGNVFVHGRTVALQDGCGAYTLHIRELRPGFLCADNTKGPWEWAMVGIFSLIGIVLLGGGIFMLLGAMGMFPERESGWWNIGVPGIASIIFGGLLIANAVRSSLGFRRLLIEGQRIALEYVVSGRTKCIRESALCSDDHLMCHLREDAEQDLFSVSTELELVELGTSITLFLMGVRREPTPGQSADDALHDGLVEAANQAFDKAKEIGDLLDIRVHY